MSVEPQPSPARGVLSEPPSWSAGVLAGVKHGFFGRAGGVSTGIYASLNAGTGSNDDPSCVAENRHRIAAPFGDDIIGVGPPIPMAADHAFVIRHRDVTRRVRRRFLQVRPVGITRTEENGNNLIELITINRQNTWLHHIV